MHDSYSLYLKIQSKILSSLIPPSLSFWNIYNCMLLNERQKVCHMSQTPTDLVLRHFYTCGCSMNISHFISITTTIIIDLLSFQPPQYIHPFVFFYKRKYKMDGELVHNKSLHIFYNDIQIHPIFQNWFLNVFQQMNKLFLPTKKLFSETLPEFRQPNVQNNYRFLFYLKYTGSFLVDTFRHKKIATQL